MELNFFLIVAIIEKECIMFFHGIVRISVYMTDNVCYFLLIVAADVGVMRGIERLFPKREDYFAIVLLTLGYVIVVGSCACFYVCSWYYHIYIPTVLRLCNRL